MENRKRADRKKQEDLALTRALIWFAAAMAVEFLLLLVNKYYVNFTADSASIDLALALSAVIKATTILGLAGASFAAQVSLSMQSIAYTVQSPSSIHLPQ